MPGVFGYFDPDGAVPRGAERRMARVLCCDSRCRAAFAHAKGTCIGVVDRGVFRGTDQVLVSDCGTRQVVLQGQVLAFSGEDDVAEPVSAARRCFCGGLDRSVLARAVGSFSAAVFDSQAQTLEMVTDRHGSHPLYYARYGRAVVFAGQQKALLASGLIRPELNPVAVSQMLQLGFVSGEATLLAAVMVMPPGSILTVGCDGLSIERYSRLEFRHDHECDWDREVSRLGELLTRAVRRAARPDARIGVPVSGGLDSRTLLALGPDPKRLPSFTFGTDGCRDLRFGSDLARAVGSPHQQFISDPRRFADHIEMGVWLTEGLAGITHFHILPHVAAIAASCDIVLNGIGGDVVLGGKYVKQPWLKTTDITLAGEAIWSWLAMQVPSQYISLVGGRLVPRDAHTEARQRFLRIYEDSLGLTPVDKAMSFLLEDRTRRFIGVGTELLRWRVESEHPFFDNEFVEAVARLPHGWRKRHRLYLAVLKRTAPAAAAVRWQHTGLPVASPYWLSWLAMAVHRGADMLASRFMGSTFFPLREMSNLSEWFRGPLRGTVESTLLSSRTLDRGMVSADIIRPVVRDHLSARRDYTDLLGVLLSLELFCRLFVDDLESSITARSDGQDNEVDRDAGAAPHLGSATVRDLSAYETRCQQ